ncbi:MAG: hypothetical protein QG602_4185, partial [Verrucomicrobiota bacterium]|nr:hypothetical protein [Verrucomicrobiota bacterium]
MTRVRKKSANATRMRRGYSRFAAGNQSACSVTYPMKLRPLALIALIIAATLPAQAADLIGKWTAEFDTQIGVQKYIYEFKQGGEQVTGQATYDHSMGKGTVQLRAIKVEGDKVSFSEPLVIEGNEITITYTGT